MDSWLVSPPTHPQLIKPRLELSLSSLSAQDSSTYLLPRVDPTSRVSIAFGARSGTGAGADAKEAKTMALGSVGAVGAAGALSFRRQTCPLKMTICNKISPTERPAETHLNHSPSEECSKNLTYVFSSASGLEDSLVL